MKKVSVQNTKPKLEKGFTNIRGEQFPDIRSLGYTSDNMYGNLGIFRNETDYDPSSYLRGEGDGVYIYQTEEDPCIGLRIYQSFAEPGFNGNGDERLLSELAKRQAEVRLTEFPLGVVSRNGYVIGQVIPYYEDGTPLRSYIGDCKKKQMLREASRVCIQVLDILLELEKAKITYLDIHAGNFLVTGKDRRVRLIDFDPSYIRIDDTSVETKACFFRNMTSFMRNIGKQLGMELSGSISSFEVAYGQIMVWGGKAA